MAMQEFTLTLGMPCVDLSLSSAPYHRVLAWGRKLVVTVGGSFSGDPGRRQWALAAWRKDNLQTPEGPHSIPADFADKKRIEKLWGDFFSDPSQWWDHRLEKASAKYPDFKHKKTQDGLWLDGKLNPPWVVTELAEMAPGTVPLHIVSRNSMLARLVKAGKFQKALDVFKEMQQEGMNPDAYSFVSAVNACSSLQALEEGKQIHRQIIESGCESDLYVGNSLVDMYAKCGSIEDAWTVFQKMPTHSVVSWNALILGHAKCGQGHKALELSQQMQLEMVEPNQVTFLGLVNACASVAALETGRLVHEQIIHRGLESDVFLLSSLVDMYAKCGSIEDACTVFNKMSTRNVVSWNAMILGYEKCGQGQKALELYQQMRQEGVDPDKITFLGLLNACASVVALEEGRRVHEQTIQSGFVSDVRVGNSLVDMYAKCGSVEDARRVFDKMPIRNVVSWNAMISGYAIHGHAKDAMIHFEQMCKEGVVVDRVTFLSLLTACSHGGLLDRGLHYFESMSSDYSISPTVEHYACMVDLLGRAGLLHEAEDLIKMMSCQLQGSVWMCLLGACRVHGNVEMGEHAAKKILELDPGNVGCHVLLSNIYSAAGKWDSSALLN